jgi:hypothetical protein
MGRKSLNFGCAGRGRIPVLCIPDENLFTVLRIGRWVYNSCRSWSQKRRFRMMRRIP